MNHIAFELILEIATPFAMQIPVTLDALLSAAIHNKNGKRREETYPLIPLTQDRGIFKASSIIVDRPGHTNVHRVSSLRSRRDMGTDLFAPNSLRPKGQYLPIDTQRGPYKASLSTYRALDARTVRFHAVGDPEACATLIRNYLPGLGKRAGGGAGEITAVHWLPSADDYSWVRSDGSAGRPIPADLWLTLPGADPEAPTMLMAVKPPYWQNENRVEAVFPIPC